MSLHDEKVRAIQNAREFLRDLLVPSKTPRVPKELRRQARSILKHFPFDMDIEIKMSEAEKSIRQARR